MTLRQNFEGKTTSALRNVADEAIQNQQASHCNSVGLETKSTPSQKAGSLNEGCFSIARCMYRHLYSCHVNMPIKLTLPPISPLKFEMTRTRFKPWSKAPTLQASSPDIPPDLPQHLLKVYVRIHLGLQGSPRHGPISAEQLKHFCDHQSQQVLYVLEKQVSTTYVRKQLPMNAGKQNHNCKGVCSYSHSSSPTAAKVLEPCPPTMPPQTYKLRHDASHSLADRELCWE